MPEGPEIRLAADRLHHVLAGRRIVAASFTPHRLRHAKRRIEGQRVLRVTSHGKAMLTEFDCGVTLYSHNQLYGIWQVRARGEIPKTNRSLRVALHTEQHSARLYSATDIELWPTARLDEHPFLSKLGPDVLNPSLTAAKIAGRLQHESFRKRALGSLYLDQGFIAGIGNYLRSEILFQAKLAPTARPMDLTRRNLQRLARATLAVSQRSYRTHGLTVTPTTRKKITELDSGFAKTRFAVFAREHRPCVNCSTPIEKDQFTARRLYWCPVCQPG